MRNQLRVKKNLLLVVVLLGLFPLVSLHAEMVNNLKAKKVNKVYLKDNKKALINPDMGWTMHFYSNVLAHYGSKLEPWDTLDDFPGVSTVYLRVPWNCIQLDEETFAWETLDTPAQRWIDKGKKVALRITATENWMTQATPQFVFDAGAKKYQAYDYFEPDYDDPIFLEKVEGFIKVMAERYDGNPNIAFVDIGHFGMWGEGHTVVTTPVHGKSWSIETQKKMIDIYCKYFKKTQLCISDDFVGDSEPGSRFPISDYAFSKGVTIRDDSILVQKAPKHWFHSEMAQLFWPTMPVILEHEHYEGSKKRGCWDKDLLLQSVEDYHASYMSIHTWPRLLLDENRDVIDKINLRMGYRLHANSVVYPKKVKKSEPFLVQWNWQNLGVAPCYKGGYPCLTLKDDRGGIVSVMVDPNFNVKSMMPAKVGEAVDHKVVSEFRVAYELQDVKGPFSRACKAGEYDVYISVGTLDGTPIFELPYDETDGKKRYKIGRIKLID